MFIFYVQHSDQGFYMTATTSTKTALLLIDIQNDYFSDGLSELVNPMDAANNAAKLLMQFRATHQPVIHVQHISTRANATFFFKDTPGVAIHERVHPIQGEPVVIKHFPNSFHQTNLLDIIKNNTIETLVIGGMMTHRCIDSTVRACQEYGIKVILIHDACATKDLEFMGQIIPHDVVQKTYMASLQGVFATVMDTQSYLSTLQ